MAKMDEWPPEKRAEGAQWIIEKRLDAIREKMPPEVFISWALSLDLLLAPLARIKDDG